MSLRVAVVGASGFVGRRLSASLAAAGVATIRINRRDDPPLPGTEARRIAEDADSEAMRAALAGADAAIHLVARVHRVAAPGAGTAPDADRYRAVNRDLALRWAHAARAAGVRRFVFASSVKAVAETSHRPLDETTTPAPEDPYGRSKLAAEVDLMGDPGLATLERVIVRPPLVYGPGVGANFLQLLRLAALPWPLPLAGAVAPRTMIAVDNLADALWTCARAPGAAGRTYFVGDADDVTVAGLIADLRRLKGRRPGLFHAPRSLLHAVAAAAGRRDAAGRLFDPLQLDCTRIRRELGWTPPQSPAQALAATQAWFDGAVRDP